MNVPHSSHIMTTMHRSIKGQSPAGQHNQQGKIREFLDARSVFLASLHMKLKWGEVGISFLWLDDNLSRWTWNFDERTRGKSNLAAFASLLWIWVCRLCDLDFLALWDATGRFCLVESLGGNDAVDFYMTRCDISWPRFLYMRNRTGKSSIVPVNIFWKASSTLLASRADVSINDRLFSPFCPFVSTFGRKTNGDGFVIFQTY